MRSMIKQFMPAGPVEEAVVLLRNWPRPTYLQRIRLRMTGKFLPCCAVDMTFLQ